jgi:hypothetical protein
MDIWASRSRVSQNVLVGQAVFAIQKSPADAAQVLTRSRDHKYQVANGKLKDVLKFIGDDPVQYQRLLDTLETSENDAIARTVAARTALSIDEEDSVPLK